MTQWLKQSTAVTVPAGPFVSDTDFKTEQTGLTISQADIRLSKNGGSYAQSNNAAGASHLENGMYGVPLDTTDTNTLGRLDLMIDESGALKVWDRFMVVPANVWDSMFGADTLQVDVAQFGNSNGAFASGRPEVNATHFGGSAGTFASGRPETNTSHIAGSAVNTANAQLGVNVVNWKGSAAPNMTGDAFARLGAPAGASVSADIAAAKADTAAILDDTGTSGVVVASGSKTGYALASNGMDGVTLPANILSASALATDAVAEIVAALLTTQMTEAYANDGVAPTLAQMQFMLWSALSEFSISGTTIACKKLDGSTQSMTFTLDDASTPTSRTRAS